MQRRRSMDLIVSRGSFEAIHLCGAGDDVPLSRDAIVWGALVHHVENALALVAYDDISESSTWTGDLVDGCATFINDAGYTHTVAFTEKSVAGASFEVDAESFAEIEDELSDLPDEIRRLWCRSREAMEAIHVRGASGFFWLGHGGDAGGVGADRVSCYARVPRREPDATDLVRVLAGRAMRGAGVLTAPESAFIGDGAAARHPDERSERVVGARAALAAVGIVWR